MNSEFKELQSNILKLKFQVSTWKLIDPLELGATSKEI